jgi:transposase
MKTDETTITIPKSEYESLQALAKENKALTEKLEWFMLQLKQNQRRLFGTSSEKSAYDGQLDLFNEAEATADAAKEEEPKQELSEAVKPYFRRKRLVNNKEALPEDIQVEVVEHTLPEAERVCPECGGAMHAIGRETTREEIVLIPAHVALRKHICTAYGCRCCEKNEIKTPIIKAPEPEPVIKGSFASPESVAHIMTEKFVMGSPLYRQEQYWNRKGLMLSRQTMSGWILTAAEAWLVPIYDVLKTKLVTLPVLHGDETVLQVLHEKDKTPQSNSYMWLYRTSGDVKHHIVLYEYQPDRRAKRPADFLKGFKGYLHTDGYEGYHSLPGITVVGCWAHARRKFDEGLKTLAPKERNGSDLLRGKEFCNKLFELERDFEGLSADERHLKRQELSKPVLDEFYLWCNSLNVRPKSALGVAKGYALNQRKYLEAFLLDGRLELSNNRAERSIKPFVISRKNFLFANTARGAKASAVMFSLIETAKENGLDPFKYLVHIFKNAPNWDLKNNPERVKLLLPENVPDELFVNPKARK